jgi:hypothetical protein
VRRAGQRWEGGRIVACLVWGATCWHHGWHMGHGEVRFDPIRRRRVSRRQHMHQREFRAYITGRILVFADDIQDYGCLDFYEDLAYLAVARSVGTRSVALALARAPIHDVLKIHDSIYFFHTCDYATDRMFVGRKG